MFLHGKRAIKVNAKMVIFGSKIRDAKAKLYDIDGDKKWVPISLSQFIISKESQEQIDRGVHAGDISGKLIIEEWFYKKLFPNG